MLAVLSTLAFAQLRDGLFGVIPVSGYVSTADGPVDGPHTVTVSLYANGDGSVTIWSAPQEVVFDRGRFTAAIGGTPAFDAWDIPTGATLHVGVSVDAGPESALTPVGWAPVSVLSVRSQFLGDLAPEDVRAKDDPVPWDDLSGVPAHLDTPYVADNDSLSLANHVFSVNTTWLAAQISAQVASLSWTATQIRDAVDPFFTTPAEATAAAQSAAYNTPSELVTALAGQDVGVRSLTANTTGGVATCDGTTVGRIQFQSGIMRVCDGTAFRQLAFAVDGATADTAALNCLDMLRKHPGVPTGTYFINPGRGPSSAAFQAYCDMTTSGGGWTMIASQENGLFSGNMKNSYDLVMPAPGVTGIRGWWFQNDLKANANELRVSNTSGETGFFATADFNGPLVFDTNTPFYDAGTASWNGVIAGNLAVVTHFQLGQVCSSAACRGSSPVDSGFSYSAGLIVIFDWQNGDTTSVAAGHAHFGGNTNIEAGWARRGAQLYVR